MVNHTYAEIDFDETKLLGDIAGVRLDLENAKRFAERLEEHFAGSRGDGELVDILTTAILVRYSRAFISGTRRFPSEASNAGLNNHIDQLSKHQQGLHKKFRNWRNTHIAHSADQSRRSEKNQVVARFVAETVRNVGGDVLITFEKR